MRVITESEDIEGLRIVRSDANGAYDLSWNDGRNRWSIPDSISTEALLAIVADRALQAYNRLPDNADRKAIGHWGVSVQQVMHLMPRNALAAARSPDTKQEEGR